MKLRILILLPLLVGLLVGCSTRELQGKLGGSTAQRLLSHSIDDLVSSLEDEQLKEMAGKSVFLNSYFLDASPFKDYADQRLLLELRSRFNANIVATEEEAEIVMTVFYNSLATDLDNFGITIPVGNAPGFESYAEFNVIA